MASPCRRPELTEAEETGTTFRENAYIKAKSACDETGLPCVADDSGLSIDYLNGEPGVYSARYAEPGKRKATVLEKLKGVPEEKRGAHFTSAICCVFPNGDVLEAEGYAAGASQRNAAAKAVSVMTPFSSAPKKAARARRSAKRRQKKRML